MKFTVEVEQETDGRWNAEVVELPGTMTYGKTREEAMAKVRSMSESDLHRLATLADRVAAGADGGVDFVIGLAVLVILILVILMLMNKRVVVR